MDLQLPRGYAAAGFYVAITRAPSAIPSDDFLRKLSHGAAHYVLHGRRGIVLGYQELL